MPPLHSLWTSSRCVISNIVSNELAKGEPRNLIVSPVSVSAVLAMLIQGAKGGAAKELEAALRLDVSQAKEAYGELSKHYQVRGFVIDLTLEFANQLFLAKSFPVNPQFKNVLTESFRSGVDLVDFQTGEGSSIINAWVSKATHGKINTLIDEALPPETALVLANAIFFQAAWDKQFIKSVTFDQDFHVKSGQLVKVPFMRDTRYLATSDRNNLNAVSVLLPFEVSSAVGNKYMLHKRDVEPLRSGTGSTVDFFGGGTSSAIDYFRSGTSSVIYFFRSDTSSVIDFFRSCTSITIDFFRSVISSAIDFFKSGTSSAIDFFRNGTSIAIGFFRSGTWRAIDIFRSGTSSAIDFFRSGTSSAIDFFEWHSYSSGQQLSLLVVLPNEKNGLADLIRKLTLSDVSEMIATDNNKLTEIQMPRFKLESKHELKEHLQQLGLEELFRNADLSRISSSGSPLAVSRVLQKATIEIDEKGGVAAAVTGAVIMPVSTFHENFIFVVDHPFLAMIVDHQKKIPLFITTVVNPSLS
ncbi:hypothetical protein PR048_006735, partial [Dryococelus australis]